MLIWGFHRMWFGLSHRKRCRRLRVERFDGMPASKCICEKNWRRNLCRPGFKCSDWHLGNVRNRVRQAVSRFLQTIYGIYSWLALAVVMLPGWILVMVLPRKENGR